MVPPFLPTGGKPQASSFMCARYDLRPDVAAGARADVKRVMASPPNLTLEAGAPRREVEARSSRCVAFSGTYSADPCRQLPGTRLAKSSITAATTLAATEEKEKEETKMAKVMKSTDSSSLAEVVDRILDKGIVIDAWAKLSLVGIELLSLEARVVVASVETYLKYAEAIGLTSTAAAPAA
jgi:gas vesicle structural protein